MTDKNNTHKKWMIIVYLAGDNNLSESMAGSFKDFGKSWANLPPNKDVAIMVYFDGNAFETPTYFCDFTDLDNPYIERVPELDSSDSRSLGMFFGWCQKRHTADKHILFLSGHSD